MKSASPPRTKAPGGFTLVELTVVIAVMVAIAVILIIGARAWLRGSDRLACVSNLRNVQTSVRAYQNLYGYYEGSMPAPDGGSRSIIRHLMNKGYITQGVHQTIALDRLCPGGGTYDIPHEEVFPAYGELYVNCSLRAAANHLPPGPPAW